MGEDMGYVLEEISEGNHKKFGIKELKRKYLIQGIENDWVFNEKTQSFLIRIDRGREESYGVTQWLFVWNGEEYRVETKDVDEKTEFRVHWWEHKEVLRINRSEELSGYVKGFREDLKIAIEKYAGFGVASSYKDKYSLKLDWK